MRIGVHLGRLDPESGGAFTFQESIWDELRNLESKHSFVAFHEGRAFNEQDSDVVALQKPQAGASETPLARACEERQIDLIWFLDNYFQRTDIPYLFTVWDLQHRLQPFFPEVNVTGWTWDEREDHFGRILPKAAAVFVGNNTGRQEIIHFYRLPPERVHAIALPTPSFALDTVQMAPRRFVPAVPYLYYPAQFWPHKNHITVLLALRILRDRYRLRFDVVFSGRDYGNRSYIEEQTSVLGLDEQVHFVGFVPRQDVIALYQNAFAMIYPSFFGPDNLPPVEAFGLGCPVVAANVAGSDEQLGDAALRIDPRDENAFAVAIGRLANEKGLREELIDKGRARARKWTAKEYVGSALAILDDLGRLRRCWSATQPYVEFSR